MDKPVRPPCALCGAPYERHGSGGTCDGGVLGVYTPARSLEETAQEAFVKLGAGVDAAARTLGAGIGEALTGLGREISDAVKGRKR